jgi:hypothetical protein
LGLEFGGAEGVGELFCGWGGARGEGEVAVRGQYGVFVVCFEFEVADLAEFALARAETNDGRNLSEVSLVGYYIHGSPQNSTNFSTIGSNIDPNNSRHW